MSTLVRSKRKPLALAVALAVLVGGLVAAPVASSPASAALTSSEIVLAKLEAARPASPAYLPNRALGRIALSNAKKYAAYGASGMMSNSQLLDAVPIGATNLDMIYTSAVGSNRAAQIGNRLVSKYLSTITGPHNYAAAAVYTSGTRSYGVVVLARYTSTPADFFTTTKPTISGKAQVGRELMANHGTYGPEPEGIFYQWKADGALRGNGNSTYVVEPEDAGRYITVTITAVKSNFYTATQTTAKTAKVVKGTFVRPATKIVGSRNVGETLSAVHGVWSPEPNLYYQWFRNDVAISGATTYWYELTTKDKGKRIDVRIIGKLEGYNASVQRTATTKLVGGRLFKPANTPTIWGTNMNGATLSADFNPWTPSPSSYKFQWRANGVAIAGATNSTFKLTAATVGKKITLSLTGALSTYQTTRKTSLPTEPVLGRQFGVAPIPTVNYDAQAATVTAKVGKWEPTPSTLTVQWFRDGVAIKGQTAKVHKLVAADFGSNLTVRVTAKRYGYGTLSANSAPVPALQK